MKGKGWNSISVYQSKNAYQSSYQSGDPRLSISANQVMEKGKENNLEEEIEKRKSVLIGSYQNY